jgi:ribosome-binding ATPase
MLASLPYWSDPIFGLVHGRIQTWYPFNLQFYVNGKEMLKNQMDKKSISYTKSDNCFTWISDFDLANDLAKKQVTLD